MAAALGGSTLRESTAVKLLGSQTSHGVLGGYKLSRVRVQIWNGARWVDAPPS